MLFFALLTYILCVAGAFTMLAQLQSGPHLTKRNPLNMSRTDNWYWTSEASFGSNSKRLTMLLSFGLSWTVLGSTFDGCNLNITEANQYSNSSQGLTDTCVFRAPYEVQYLENFLCEYDTSSSTMVFQDLVQLAGLEVSNAQFHMGTKRINTLGFGLLNSDWGMTNETQTLHPNIIQQLYSAKAINSSLLSMWFNPNNESTFGQFVIGGIDESKYTGELFRYPIVNSYDPQVYSESPIIEVKMSYIAGNYLNVSFPVGVGLRPDITYSSLPSVFVNALGRLYGKYDSSLHAYKVDPKLLYLEERILFGFGQFNLSVPVKDIVSNYTSLNKADAVYLLLRNVSTESWLGIDILKHAFIAIDYNSREVALAQGATSLESEEISTLDGLDSLSAAYPANDTSLAIQLFYTTTMFIGSLRTVQVASTQLDGLSANGGSSSSSMHGLVCLISGLLLGL